MVTMASASKSLALLLAALFLTSLVTLPSTISGDSQSTWTVKTVDANAAGYGNGYCPIVVDSNGIPHIAYTGHTPPNIYDIVKYASWNGSNWNIQEIPYGTAIDLKLDSKGNPHILYETGVYGGLMYARWTGLKWLTQTVTSTPVVYASLALDTFGNPHIAYTSGEVLKYASLTGSTWKIQSIDSYPESSFQYSLALDSNNTPYILYNPSSITDNSQAIGIHAINIKLAIDKNSSWVIQNVILPYPSGELGKIILDSKGRPNFILTQYIFSGNRYYPNTIVYVKWDGSSWNTEIAISNVTTSNDFRLGSLSLDVSDNPHLNYITSSGNLIYAKRTGTVWNVQHVNSNITARGPCYLAVDSNGNPHISYRGFLQDQFGRNATIAYAIAIEPTITSEPTSSSASLTIPILATISVIAIAIVSVLLFRRHRKTANLIK